MILSSDSHVSAGRRFLVLLGCALAAGCSGPAAPEEQGGGAVLTTRHPEAMRTFGWLEFDDLSFHPEALGGDPREPYVRGWVIGNFFSPEGEVVGARTERPRGTLIPGVLELRTRRFRGSREMGPAQPPVIAGLQHMETGGFFPTSGVLMEVPSEVHGIAPEDGDGN